MKTVEIFKFMFLEIIYSKDFFVYYEMDHVYKIVKLSFLNRLAILVTQQAWTGFFRILRATDY